MPAPEPIRDCTACLGEGLLRGTGDVPRICGACCEGKIVLSADITPEENVEAFGVADTLRPRAWFLKVCACGRAYDAKGWAELPLDGRVGCGGMLLETRRCECGSSPAIELDSEVA